VDGSDLGQELFILNKDLCDFPQYSQKNLTLTPCSSALRNAIKGEQQIRSQTQHTFVPWLHVSACVNLSSDP